VFRLKLRFVLWYGLFWTALGVFFASQLALFGLPWTTALAFSLPRWYSWAVLAPAVVWTDRRLLAHRPLAWRVTLHVPLGVAWTLLAIALRLVTRPLRGSPPVENVWPFFLERFYWDLLIYAVIAGVAIARDYVAQVRLRERQAHDLALQAAELERRLMEARLQALRAQLHPHFLFNALNTISAFTEANPQGARRLMSQLGDLLRASLTHGSQPLVTLGQELTFLDDYLAIESARFEDRLTVDVDVEEDLLDVMVPGFVLQPIVENAIRHGIGPRLAGGHVHVTAVRTGSEVTLQVRDNGVGLPPGWPRQREAGVGLKNVAARLEHVYGRPGLLHIDPAQGGGVDVRIDIPLDTNATSSRRPETAPA
jgi:signal transduction histidine kinase